MQKKHKHILVPCQRYQDSRHLLQNPKVANYVMGFRNRAQSFTGPNYLDVTNTKRRLNFLLKIFLISGMLGNLVKGDNFDSSKDMCLGKGRVTLQYK